MNSNQADRGSEKQRPYTRWQMPAISRPNRSQVAQLTAILSRTSHRAAGTPRRRTALLAVICLVVMGLFFVGMAPRALRFLEMHATVAPLAPAPHPPTPPVVAAAPRRHLLPRLRINPLAGLASWYGSMWNGRKTASGEDFDESQLTAAHKSLPLGTLVRVTNLRSMRSVIVRINDRGALSPSRVIDLSSAAASEIGMLGQGLARVKLEILGSR